MSRPARSMRRLAVAHQGRLRFHVWRFAHDCLLHDVLTGQIVFISEAMFEVLRRIENGLALDVAATEVSDRFGASVVADLLATLAGLEQGRLSGTGHDLDLAPFFQVEPRESDRGEFVRPLLNQQPRSLMLLVAQGCNLKCSYCYEVRDEWHRQGARMSADDAFAAIDDLLDRSGSRAAAGSDEFLTITFFGGEPLLNFEVVRASVAHCARRGAERGKQFYFTLTTNGTLLTDEIVEFLVSHRFGVMVSLDGPAELHDQARVDRAGRGSHAAAVRGIKRLLQAQQLAGVKPLKLRATLSAGNSDMREVEDYFREEFPGARTCIGASYAESFEDAAQVDLQPADTEALASREDRFALRLLEEAVATGAWSDPRQYPETLRQVGQRVRTSTMPERWAPAICGVGRNVRATTPDGSVFPCHRYVGMDAFRLGTTDSSAEDLTDTSARYYASVFDALDATCSGCWARYSCGGTCPWSLSRSDGRVDGPDASFCGGVRGSFERVLWLYLRLAHDAPEFLDRILGPAPGAVEPRAG